MFKAQFLKILLKEKLFSVFVLFVWLYIFAILQALMPWPRPVLLEWGIQAERTTSPVELSEAFVYRRRRPTARSEKKAWKKDSHHFNNVYSQSCFSVVFGNMVAELLRRRNLYRLLYFKLEFPHLHHIMYTIQLYILCYRLMKYD